MAKVKYTIGIDLGTTFSVGCFWHNNSARYVTDELGKTTIPSMVLFQDGPALVGNAAKVEYPNALRKSPDTKLRNCIFDAKRLIGRRWGDKEIERFKGAWDFEISAGEQSEAGTNDIIIVSKMGEFTECYKPHEVSAMVLMKIKHLAEKNVGAEVKDAVITVPAYFDDNCKKATKVAGEIAGFNVLSIINEPTAAAIAYASEFRSEEDKNILVFDLGGGTFDVTLLRSKTNSSTGLLSCDVIATGGDLALGGRDFEENLFKHLQAKFKEQNGRELSEFPKSFKKVKAAIEEIKTKLSVNPTADVVIETGSDDWEYKLSSDEFVKINQKEFDKCVLIVDNVLTSKNFPKEKIDEVILVGGSTYIPYVRNRVKEYFNGKEPHSRLEPELVVARGAAIYAAHFNSQTPLGIYDVISQDVGVEVKGNRMSVIVPRNSKVPTTKVCDDYSTEAIGQAQIRLRILQGNLPNASDNTLLSEHIISGWKTSAFEKSQLSIGINVNREGMVTADVKCLSDSSWSGKSVVATTKENLSMKITPEEILKSNKKIRERMEKKPQQSAPLPSNPLPSNPPPSNPLPSTPPNPPTSEAHINRLKKIISLATETEENLDEHARKLIKTTKKWIETEKNPVVGDVEKKSAELLDSLGEWKEVIKDQLED